MSEKKTGRQGDFPRLSRALITRASHNGGAVPRSSADGMQGVRTDTVTMRDRVFTGLFEMVE